mmetsp:Transcript_14285/g.23492  ORF Transcript_14285/g.23492 Transcript_14285/m.23492 type:complete len:352 (+) Transcript_14285:518-1573(+)
MSTLLNNFREKTQRAGVGAGGVTKWGRTSQRTSTYKARDISNATGGTMTTRTGEPASKRESYTAYLQGRVATEMPDIDSADHENPLAVTEYVNDIFSYWFRVEPDTQVAPNYMLIQTDINDKMRAILIDWLVEVHLKFKLMPETLFLTHNLIDRFLSKKVVTRKNLQLVGVTAMLLASKYEEIWAPEVRDFVYISDKAYTREQILEMEKQMLNTLGFHLTVPTPYQFMSRFFKAAKADKQFQLLASFIVESSLPDYSMLKYPGSLLAASAVYVAMRTLGKGEGPDVVWGDVMEAHTRYTEEDIRPCANAMARLQRKSATASLSAVHKKYSNPKFMEVARLPAPAGLGEDSV